MCNLAKAETVNRGPEIAIAKAVPFLTVAWRARDNKASGNLGGRRFSVHGFRFTVLHAYGKATNEIGVQRSGFGNEEPNVFGQP